MWKFIIIRLCSLFGLWLLALWLPWWFLLIVAALVIWRQAHFYELLLVAWGYDSLYGPSGNLAAADWPLLATLIVFLLIWLIELVKESVVIYRPSF